MIPDYPTGTDIPLPAQGTWPDSVHVLREETAAALQAAEATGRPLLIRGLPGVGKSETARAAAAAAGRPFLCAVIDGRTEPEDLKWRFDAVSRLSDSQAGKARDEADYVAPQALWWAFGWKSAETQAVQAGVAPPQGPRDKAWAPATHRAVLLLDEIDKADPDLPNALLEVLGNRGFPLPFRNAEPVVCSESNRPLVIITTNEERELPGAFLRRCLVTTLSLPSDRDALRAELVSLAQRHEKQAVALRQLEGPRIEKAMLEQAADTFLELRGRLAADAYQPGTSEYLDLARALAELYPCKPKVQAERLKVLAGFIDKSRQ
ncbi:MAG: AAA family ATPase [Rubrivivax sp.]|nr:AAA family ATPase [Rubrivivax sp.]